MFVLQVISFTLLLAASAFKCWFWMEVFNGIRILCQATWEADQGNAAQRRERWSEEHSERSGFCSNPAELSDVRRYIWYRRGGGGDVEIVEPDATAEEERKPWNVGESLCVTARRFVRGSRLGERPQTRILGDR